MTRCTDKIMNKKLHYYGFLLKMIKIFLFLNIDQRQKTN